MSVSEKSVSGIHVDRNAGNALLACRSQRLIPAYKLIPAYNFANRLNHGSVLAYPLLGFTYRAVVKGYHVMVLGDYGVVTFYRDRGTTSRVAVTFYHDVGIGDHLRVRGYRLIKKG